MGKIKIRTYKNDDLTQVYHLLKELEIFTSSNKQIDFYSVQDIFKDMAKSSNIYKNIIAEEDGIPIGYLSMILFKTPFHIGGGTALINELVVKSEKRGKGIGTKLITAAIETAKENGMDEIEVGTELNNPRAHDFYEKMGFGNKYSLFGMKFK